VVAPAGRERRQLAHPPARPLKSGTGCRSICDKQDEATPERCSRQKEDSGRPQRRGSGCRRADSLKAYYAEGILSLSEKQTKACFGFVANFEGKRRGKLSR